MPETPNALNERVNRLQGYLAQDPHNLALQADVADACLQAARWADARSVLARTVAQAPNDGPARYRLALVARMEGQLEEAAGLLNALLGEGIDAPAIRLELAHTAAASGDWATAKQALAPLDAWALPAAVGDDVLLLRLRAMHHLTELDEALALGAQWAAVRGDAMPTLGMAALATLSLDAGQVDAAAQWLVRAGSEAVAHNAELLGAAGFVDLHEGRLAEAATRFAASTDVQPAMGRGHLGSGLAQAALGRMPAAIEALRRATETMPTHLGSWHALAWMQLLSNDVAAATATFEQALALDRTFGDSHGGVALMAALRGDRALAQESIRVGQRLDPMSMNVAMAKIVLAEGKGLNDVEVVRKGLVTLINSSQQPGLAQVLQRVAAGASRV
jgi:tetratricopeptide (TPR) repeat protein